MVACSYNMLWLASALVLCVISTFLIHACLHMQSSPCVCIWLMCLFQLIKFVLYVQVSSKNCQIYCSATTARPYLRIFIGSGESLVSSLSPCTPRWSGCQTMVCCGAGQLVGARFSFCGHAVYSGALPVTSNLWSPVLLLLFSDLTTIVTSVRQWPR